MEKPIIAITMGDPAGIGPEVCVKALSSAEINDISRPIIIGDSEILKYAIKISKLAGISLNPIKDARDAKFEKNIIDVIDLKNVDIKNFKLSEVSKMCGKASFEYVAKAIDMAQKKQVSAIVTAPINKESIHLAGYKFQGHTEILASRTKTVKYAMMFIADKFWVILVTTHMALKDAAKNISRRIVLERILMADQALKMAGKKKGRIAVAGLNPHAGEAGIFGTEEIKKIAPAVADAKKMGINVAGPISPDAVFNLANAGAYDIVVSMYHDQGLIPLKLVSFNKSVNMTLGLPFVRTSVDHGTGFNIAGKGIANPQSMMQAIKAAVKFAKNG